MMAARVTDPTAHGGLVTGPGCPTVLIGKIPAARIGDMHMCPMVTPGVPPVPHVGGPIVGGCPSVLIGKMPAARATDMAICVGPPSSIIMGCPTVLIGSGGGGGGGGGSDDEASSMIEGLKAGKIKAVAGTEALPIEIQAAVLTLQNYKTTEFVQEVIHNLVKAAEQAPEEDLFTIADIVDILESVESEEGYEAARFFASYLDFGKITGMARKFISGDDDNIDNDPNIMPTRFMIIYGADDSKLQTIDNHPYRVENEEHLLNVINLQKGLKLLGYELPEDGIYGEETWIAHVKFIANIMNGDAIPYDELQDESEEESRELGTLKMQLDFNPEDPLYENYKFQLYSTDRKKTYSCTKTVADDADRSNNALDLVFDGLDKTLRYTLEMHDGISSPGTVIYQNRHYDEL